MASSSTFDFSDAGYYYDFDPNDLTYSKKEKSAQGIKHPSTDSTIENLFRCVEKAKQPDPTVTLEKLENLKKFSQELEVHLENKILKNHPILGKLLIAFQKRFGTLSRLTKLNNNFSSLYETKADAQKMRLPTFTKAVSKAPSIEKAAQTIVSNVTPLSPLREIPSPSLKEKEPEEPKGEATQEAIPTPRKEIAAPLVPEEVQSNQHEDMPRVEEPISDQSIERTSLIEREIAQDKSLRWIEQFLQTVPSDKEVKQTITSLQVLLTSEKIDPTTCHALKKVLSSYQQLSPLQDKVGLTLCQMLKMCLFIEQTVPTFTKRADIFFKRQTEALNESLPKGLEVFDIPFSLIHDKERNDVYILLKHKVDILDASGAFKKVTAAVRLPLHAEGERAKLVAQSVTIDETRIRELKAARHEQATHQFFKGDPGIWDLLFFCDYRTYKVDQNTLIGEWVDKVSAFSALADGDLSALDKTLAFDERLAVTHILIEGLTSIHRKNYVHGDIKRENALLRRNADGTLTTGWIDFGIAFNVLNSRPTQPFTLGSYGTTKFTAPELLISTRFKGDFYKTDVWSLGCMLYTMHFQKDPSWLSLLEQKLAKVKKKQQLETILQDEIEKPLQALQTKQKRQPLSREDAFACLIYKMLRTDPKERIDMETALKEIQKIQSL